MKTLAMLSICLVASQAVSADDVYNFYFQKAPGPTTVIQGGAQKTEAQTVEPIPSQPVAAPIKEESAVATSAPAPIVEKKSEFKNWELAAGYALVADEIDQFKGWGIAVNYNFNRYLGLGAGFVHANDEEFNHYKDNAGRTPFDFHIGAIVTPIHMQLFGYSFLELGLTAGFMTQAKLESKGVVRTTPGYIGPRIAINFTQNFGLIADIRTIPINGARYGQATTGLRMRFQAAVSATHEFTNRVPGTFWFDIVIV